MFSIWELYAYAYATFMRAVYEWSLENFRHPRRTIRNGFPAAVSLHKYSMVTGFLSDSNECRETAKNVPRIHCCHRMY